MLNRFSDNTDQAFIPATLNDLSENNDLKVSHDRYEVYVNGDYVGKKTLLTQNDRLEDVLHYLQNKGFSNLQAEVDGDHYQITSENPQAVKEVLETYLTIR